MIAKPDLAARQVGALDQPGERERDREGERDRAGDEDERVGQDARVERALGIDARKFSSVQRAPGSNGR